MIEPTTFDNFLGGQVRAQQPQKGYRAGVDAVLLASAVEAKAGQTVLELGVGAGVASLCLNARIKNLQLTGIEVQESYANLGRQNALSNNADLTIETADIRNLPKHLTLRQFDHVFMNPPYFDRALGANSPNAGRDMAMGGNASIEDWIDTARRRLAPKGTLTLIHRIEYLPKILACLTFPLGSVRAKPIAPRDGHAPKLFLLRAHHSGRAPFELLAPFVMHVGHQHEGDFESYTPAAKAIFRDGAKLDWNG